MSHKTYIAKTFQGLEEVLAKELKALGAENIVVRKRAVMFDGDKELLYTANYRCRTALRILMPLATFESGNEFALYGDALTIQWDDFLPADGTYAIDAGVYTPEIKQVDIATNKLKEAISDWYKERYDVKPTLNVKNPMVRINLHIDRSICSISLDSSGNPLHRRAYRLSHIEEPLNEVFAAGMLLLAGYDGTKPLYDPMCGSGTLLIEAACIARNLPPFGYRRVFGFQQWLDFDKELWNEVRAQVRAGERKPVAPIYGGDRSMSAVQLTKKNLGEASVGGIVKLEKIDFLEAIPPTEKGILIMNPPSKSRTEAMLLFKKVNAQLQEKYQGWQICLITDNQDVGRIFSIRPTPSYHLVSGKLECKMYVFGA